MFNSQTMPDCSATSIVELPLLSAWLFIECDLPSVFSGGPQSRVLLIHIAEDPDTSSKILELLATCPDPEVRVAASSNPSAPFEMLQLLVKDECANVRYALAENARLPERILQELQEDDNPYVAARANRSLSRQTRAAAPSTQPILLLEFGRKSMSLVRVAQSA